MTKFQLFHMTRAAAIIPVAIQSLPHQAAGDGYVLAEGPELHHVPEQSHIHARTQRAGFGAGGGVNTLSNGTGTYANGTRTSYFWPIP